jgi:hypothetical protein
LCEFRRDRVVPVSRTTSTGISKPVMMSDSCKCATFGACVSLGKEGYYTILRGGRGRIIFVLTSRQTRCCASFVPWFQPVQMDDAIYVFWSERDTRTVVPAAASPSSGLQGRG